MPTPHPILAVHGGAFTHAPAPHETALLERWRAAVAEALAAGGAVLAQGGSALDAVTEAVAAMEDGAVFNAGRAAVAAADGQVWLDAAVMDGARQQPGAVAAVQGLRNPVRAARAVLADNRHVLIAGPGARDFALAAGCAPAPADWFTGQADGPEPIPEWARTAATEIAARSTATAQDSALGRDTVGAVARDALGHLAAATSTGGLRHKRPGRVGDAPLPGAGTWADPRVAVSCTGAGECFVRAAVAHRIACLVEFGRPLDEAAADALERMVSLGGDGGCIVLGSDGLPHFAIRAAGMARGVWEGGRRQIALLAGEELVIVDDGSTNGP